MTTIAQAIADSGLGPTAIARKVGVSHVAVHYWATGAKTPARKHIRPLAEALKRKIFFTPDGDIVVK